MTPVAFTYWFHSRLNWFSVSGVFPPSAENRNYSGFRFLGRQGISILSAFNVLNVILLYKALIYEPGAMLGLDVLKMVMVFLGVLLVLLGNVMPKVRRNSIVGVRTHWSMSGDAVWQKSQRFGGISSVVCGLLLILFALFFSGNVAGVALVVLTLIWAFLCVAASYHYYKAEKSC